MSDEVEELEEEDNTCPRCHQGVRVPSDLEKPEHGMCWLCSTEVVTEQKARIDDLVEIAQGWQDKYMDAVDGVHWRDEQITQLNKEKAELLQAFSDIWTLSLTSVHVASKIKSIAKKYLPEFNDH